MTEKGTVYLIGAGPGDAGLLTLRGKELLERCDAVVHDRLVNGALLRYVRRDAEIVYAGKMGGDHAMPQEEMNRLLVAMALAGKNVARLKGGDPYLFGRGAEEAEELHRAGIAFEVVPGVTSAVAASAYAGIPLTHRAFASSVCFATGHEDPAKPGSAHNWKALATGSSTLVFFMGMKNLPEIAANLTANGMDASTPAALIGRGTTSRHRSVAGALADLPRLAREHGFSAPSLIVVGKVVALRDSLNWFEKKPLLGKGVLVTRACGQASRMGEKLAALGANAVTFPVIRIESQADAAPVRETVRRVRDYDWVVFTSANGVRCFWEALDSLGLDGRAFAAAGVAAIGPATADALAAKGIRADFVPRSHIAEALLAGLVARGVAGKRVLVPRAETARDTLPLGLERAGAHCRALPVYRTLPAAAGCDFAAMLREEAIRYVAFTSSSTVSHFLAAVGGENLARHPDLRFACIGPVTAKTLENAGFVCHVMPSSYTIPALVAAISEDAASGTP